STPARVCPSPASGSSSRRRRPRAARSCSRSATAERPSSPPPGSAFSTSSSPRSPPARARGSGSPSHATSSRASSAARSPARRRGPRERPSRCASRSEPRSRRRGARRERPMARMTSSGCVRALAVVAAAGGYALALPPFDHAALAWLTLVPLLLIVRTASPRRAFAWGALYGFTAAWMATWWLTQAVARYFAAGILPAALAMSAAYGLAAAATFGLFAAGLIGGIWLIGTARALAGPTGGFAAQPVAVVQTGVPPAFHWTRAYAEQQLMAHVRATEALPAERGPALIIWPENALTLYLENEPLVARQLARLAARHRADLLFGAPRYADGHTFNSASLLRASGQSGGHYDKQRLVLFAEAGPLAAPPPEAAASESPRDFTA